MIDPEILAHYSLGQERERLEQGISSPIEFFRTKELLARYLPHPPARVLDVGGAAGRYSSWLAAQGYDVHLVDPVPLHIEQAEAASRQGTHAFTVELGDARSLQLSDASVQAVLLMGPLYHLVDREDRLLALREAARVTVPGGVVVVAAISRFASLLDGLASSHLSDPAFRDIVETDLTSGVHANPSGRPEWFTTAYFHHPDELAEEVQASGLRLEALLGVEGPGWLTASEIDPEHIPDEVLFAARALEAEPSVVGASAHLLAVGRT
ncbi:MAG: class I SAM-dependent methyltransferase [Actinomycetes bacterium]